MLKTCNYWGVLSCSDWPPFNLLQSHHRVYYTYQRYAPGCHVILDAGKVVTVRWDQLKFPKYRDEYHSF